MRDARYFAGIFLRRHQRTQGRSPLSAETAHAAIQEMLDSRVIDVLASDLDASFFKWLKRYVGVTKRYQIYDASIAYAMYRNRIARLFTRNARDFRKFDFIEPEDPFRETKEGPAPAKRRLFIGSIPKFLRNRFAPGGFSDSKRMKSRATSI